LIETRYVGEERYAARGCGKAAVFRCKRRVADDAVICNLEEGSLIASSATVASAAPSASASAKAEPLLDPRACDSAAQYDERARTATSPAREQLEKIAQTKHKECDALSAPHASPSPDRTE
jgi:hypothetical protein